MPTDGQHAFRRFFRLGAIVACSAAAAGSAAAQSPAGGDAPWLEMGREELEVVVGLASAFEPAEAARRDAVLDTLAAELREADRQFFIVQMAYFDDAAEDFRIPASAASDSVSDVLWAFRDAFLRFRGAEHADDPEWMPRHLESGKRYASRAAEGLRAQALADERRADALRSEPFAVRRSADEAIGERRRLRSEGLSPEHRGLLATGGFTEAQISVYEQELRSVPADSLGISIVELYGMLAELRRLVAAQLEVFAGPGVPSPASLSQTFVIGNPNDRDETIDLFIRPVSMPPRWELSITTVEADSGAAPSPRVQEVEASRHYRIRLAARERIQLTSAVFPVGIVGQNTTARWSVEGRIRNELIGGVVHEMVVPAMAVGPQPEIAASGASWFGWPTLAFATAVLVLATLGSIIFLRRRRTEA